jgi:hypothetical protein
MVLGGTNTDKVVKSELSRYKKAGLGPNSCQNRTIMVAHPKSRVPQGSQVGVMS